MAYTNPNFPGDFPMTFSGETIYGIYDDQTGIPLFGTAGTAAAGGSPVEGLVVGGVDSNGNYQPLSQTPNGYLNVNGDFVGTLTNNNAAPVATNVGALTALAATAYTTVSYTNGFQVLPVTDLHGALNQDLQAVAGVALGATAVVAFGSAPAAVNVPAVNASIFSGTTAITNTGGALNVEITGSSTTITVAGSLTNNNAAPAANNVGVLAFIAETAWNTITYTTGNEVLATVDTHGATWTDLGAVAGSAVVVSAAGVQEVGIVGHAAATLDSTVVSGTAPTNGLAVLGIYNVTEPAPANTQATALQQDQAANLLEFPGIQFKVGAAWTSGTGAGTFQYPTGTATQGQDSGAPAYVVQLDQTTTITGGVVTFQGTYDNVNWVTIPTAQVLNPNTFAQLTNPYTLVPSTNQPFLILAQGYVGIRADLSTAISGTGSVTPYWSSLAYEPAIASSTSSTVSGTLTNNNAAPIADNVGVLGFIAETAYNTVTYTTGNQVLAVTDLHGAINNDMQASAGVQLAATAVVAFGTGSPTGVVIAANTATFVNVGGTPTAVTGTGTSMNVNITNTTVPVAGTLTNNNAAPGANNIGALAFIAETAYNTVTYTTGDQVLAVTDLHGAVNGDLQAVAGVQLGATAVVNFGSAPAAVAVPAVNSSIFSGTTALTNTGGALNVEITGSTTTLTVAGSLTNNNAAPAANNIGALTAITVGTFPTLTPPTDTVGDLELLTVTQGGSHIIIPADEAYANRINYYAVNNGATFKTVTAANTPMFSIKANSAAVQFLIRQWGWLTNGTAGLFNLVHGATLTGSTFAAASPSTHMLFDTAATSFTGGTVVMSGYAMQGLFSSFQNLLISIASGTTDIWTVSCSPQSGSTPAVAELQWSEITAAI
jgi:hypothetical protein